MTFNLHTGDALAILRSLPENSFDGCLCDPPYGLSKHTAADVERCLAAWSSGEVYLHGKSGFMSQSWDSFTPGPEVWREVLRVVKPGSRVAAFAGARTQDLMAVAMEMAGLEYEATLAMAYGSGFPKSLSVSKALDKAAGAERPVVGTRKKAHIGGAAGHEGWQRPSHFNVDGTPKRSMTVTAPATEAAQRWDGWGTQLKPAYEPLLVFRKPGGGPVPAISQHVFFCAKPGKKERNAGLGEFAAVPSQHNSGGIGRACSVEKRLAGHGQNAALVKNPHPTLKGSAVVAQMARVLFPAGGRGLVPFSGSGSEVAGLLRAGFEHVEGAELSEEFVQIARARIPALVAAKA